MNKKNDFNVLTDNILDLKDKYGDDKVFDFLMDLVWKPGVFMLKDKKEEKKQKAKEIRNKLDKLQERIEKRIKKNGLYTEMLYIEMTESEPVGFFDLDADGEAYYNG